MPDPEYKVVSAIPGRIRLRIQKLHEDADFASKLQALVSALKPVTDVRVDPAAASIVVHYKENSLSEVELKEQLATAIEQAAGSQRSVQMEAKVSGYEFQGLTAYEYLQVREIIKWRQQPASFLANLSGKALEPVQKVADALIPNGFLKKVVSLLETSTENWHEEWEALKQQAKVDDLGQLKKIPLEQCDRLAESVKDRAVGLAAVEGAAGALVGMAGEVTDVDLFLRVALQTIHRTGLCYGYAPQAELERQFSWAILEVATALTTQERQNELLRLEALQHVLYQRTIEDSVEESIKAKLKDLTVEAILMRVLPHILELESANALPVIGIVTGIAGARSTISEVSTAARREFQPRRLLEKQQIRRHSDV